MWLNYAGLGVSAHEGHVSPAYRCYWIARDVDRRFIHHLMRSSIYVQGYTRSLTGIRPNSLQMSRDHLMDFPVLLPPIAEQAAIAAFLDRETAKIDSLVDEQRRLIELLKEKRQAVISRAVTKGLDPLVPTKISGVEWLGEVPEHWTVAPVSYRYEIQLGQMLNEERARGEYLKPYLRVIDVQWHAINTDDLPLMNFPPEAQRRYRLEPGDLLVNEGGTYVGRSAIWIGGIDECYYQRALHRLRPRDRKADTAEFFLYVMEMATQRGVFVAQANQTTIDHLTAEQFRATRFAFPPLEEQAKIATHLRSETTKFAQMIGIAQQAMELLQERRAALISAAVTGKIDVRSAAPEQAIAA
jgi:type I restriction enzyme S subunit